MRRPLLTFTVLVGGAYAAYTYLLDADTKAAVRQAGHAIFDGVKDVVTRIQGAAPIDMTSDATAAQHWAAEQWEAAGFGPETA